MNNIIYASKIQRQLKEWVLKLNRVLGYTKYIYEEGINDDVMWVDVTNEFTRTILAYRYDNEKSECFLQNKINPELEFEETNPNWERIQELLLLLTIS